MKKLLPLFASLAFLTTVSGDELDAYAPPTPHGQATGRYTIIAASVEDDPPSTVAHPSLFRLDSATGRVWKLHAFEGGHKVTFDGWLPVAEDVSGLLTALARATNTPQKSP